ncbi:aldo/keto reductase [Dyadobacter chenwenxiniae]|uniref:Aldo/keto reductase n=1 Tax=Dyadobacter chenwenxiniae TaxID=2906456 RepID=A0A9X1PGV8_9BACT|nr:aldo/keto reductase [Dyadobacter chenwenxiniae]MCF0060503.1 aldo/keto reductase [Dyadobacter chenwenxiniae]UON86235.1 aldo/keto reductase [Dyadobacter chenwenxiniae]
MRTIELVEGIQSSVLGLGCAPVLGSIDSKTCGRALSLAFEHGITHYDLARSYGFGDAEKLVGRVFKNNRDKIVLTSKFGIKADWKASLLRPMKPIVRILRGSEKKHDAHLPPKQGTGKSASDLLFKRVEINSMEMYKSLEESLKALKTDYLDYFMVHEPLKSITNIDEISEMAMRLKASGKIRAFGLAYMQSQKHLHESYFDRFDILQFNSPPGVTAYRKLAEERWGEPNIIFSPVRGGTWDMSPAEKIEKLIRDFPESVILCSMFSESHLKENVKLVG